MKPSVIVETKEEILTEPIEKVEVKETLKIKPKEEAINAKLVNNPKSDIKQAGGLENMVK